MDYNHLHQELADKFQTNSSYIGFIRGVAQGEYITKEKVLQIIGDIIKKQRKKRKHNKQYYIDIATFINSISQFNLKYILTYGHQDKKS